MGSFDLRFIFEMIHASPSLSRLLIDICHLKDLKPLRLLPGLTYLKLRTIGTDQQTFPEATIGNWLDNLPMLQDLSIISSGSFANADAVLTQLLLRESPNDNVRCPKLEHLELQRCIVSRKSILDFSFQRSPVSMGAIDKNFGAMVSPGYLPTVPCRLTIRDCPGMNDVDRVFVQESSGQLSTTLK
jgi:hypothetical protein